MPLQTNYGDVDNADRDVKTLHEILGRQGDQMLIDVIAESIGMAAAKYKFTGAERAMTMIAAVDRLEEAIKERI